MPVSSPSQNFLGLARRTTPRRHGDLDRPDRPQDRHPPRQRADLPHSVRPHRTPMGEHTPHRPRTATRPRRCRAAAAPAPNNAPRRSWPNAAPTTNTTPTPQHHDSSPTNTSNTTTPSPPRLRPTTLLSRATPSHRGDGCVEPEVPVSVSALNQAAQLSGPVRTLISIARQPCAREDRACHQGGVNFFCGSRLRAVEPVGRDRNEYVFHCPRHGGLSRSVARRSELSTVSGQSGGPFAVLVVPAVVSFVRDRRLRYHVNAAQTDLTSVKVPIAS